MANPLATGQAKRLLRDTLELLRCLEKPTALAEWTVLRATPKEHNLDHYQKIPNGLGD